MNIVQPSYDPGAYSLRFYKEFVSMDGTQVRLEIFRKNNELRLPSQEIAGLTALSLTLEGNGEIDDPITKSTVQFSIVDDVFREDPLNLRVKHGKWEELYTPDATAYMVVINTRSGDDAQWDVRWRGYVTPDSWEEDLDSYGYIHITARDNIGHLADFDFDYQSAYETISVSALLREAMKKVSMPMELRFNTDNEGQAVAVIGGDIDIMAAGVSLEAFHGKSWYDAVEGVLASLGMTMRYTDDGSVTVMHLANLPLYGSVTPQSALTPIFHGGTLTLVPAYKEITSEVDFGAQEECELNVYAGLEFTGEEGVYNYAYESIVFPAGGTTTGSGQAPYYKIAGAARGWDSLSAMFDPSKYEIGYFLQRSEGESAKDYVFLVANQTSGQQQFYTFDTNSLDILFTAEFTQSPLCIRNGQLYDAYSNLAEITYVLMAEGNGITRYWNGYDWQNGFKELTVEYDAQNSAETIFEVALRSCDEILNVAKVTIAFQRIVYKTMDTYTKTGIYARLKSMKIGLNAPMLETDKVRTINNEAYNVKADRDLDIGALSANVAFLTVQSYVNALWDTTNQGELYPFPYKVFIGLDAKEIYPLPVIVHRQLLMFHHLAHPMLSGNCSVAGHQARFDRLYQYKGVDYILQGGTLDFTSGMFSGIMLRGFISYNDLWNPMADMNFLRDANGEKLYDIEGRLLIALE